MIDLDLLSGSLLIISGVILLIRRLWFLQDTYRTKSVRAGSVNDAKLQRPRATHMTHFAASYIVFGSMLLVKTIVPNSTLLSLLMFTGASIVAVITWRELRKTGSKSGM